MSTPNTVRAQLQNLIDISNRVTGKSDTDLTGAVNALINERDSFIDGSITEVYSEVLRLSQNCLPYRNNLVSAFFPNATLIGNAAFYFDANLKYVKFPNVSSVENNAFNGCTSLEYVKFPKITYIGVNVFRDCTNLKAIVFSNLHNVCKLSSFNSFIGTFIESGTGYIYVPRVLIDIYKTETNWTTFASQFRALEDYTVDGTIDGELDWDKVNGGAA